MSCWTVPGRFDFSIPEAQRLSDLSSVDSDLEAVVRLCVRCERLLGNAPKVPPTEALAWWDDVQALGDLMFAAVIRYGRTLSSGVRQGIPTEWIESLPMPLRESHSYFKALRDMYVAHSVSQLEDNQVFVMLSPQFAEQQEPNAITVDRGRLASLKVGSSATSISRRSVASVGLERNRVGVVQVTDDRVADAFGRNKIPRI
jgi:hypothetical protein